MNQDQDDRLLQELALLPMCTLADDASERIRRRAKDAFVHRATSRESSLSRQWSRLWAGAMEPALVLAGSALSLLGAVLSVMELYG